MQAKAIFEFLISIINQTPGILLLSLPIHKQRDLFFSKFSSNSERSILDIEILCLRVYFELPQVGQPDKSHNKFPIQRNRVCKLVSCSQTLKLTFSKKWVEFVQELSLYKQQSLQELSTIGWTRMDTDGQKNIREHYTKYNTCRQTAE